MTIDSKPPPPLSALGCTLVLVAAFFGWLFGGFQLAISSLAVPSAVKDLTREKLAAPAGAEKASGGGVTEGRSGASSPPRPARAHSIAAWNGRLTCAFLLGAAFGGYAFGWAGDRFGRSRAMALSILCYSLGSAATVYAVDPWQLLVIRFVTCMGVGGIWPNGIAIVSEAWPSISRPVLSGAIGTAANVGIAILSAVAKRRPVTSDDWHWIMWLSAAPAALGVFTLLFVPESPRWLAVIRGVTKQDAKPPGLGEIFSPPILGITLLGIVLGTVPQFGGWGSANWVMPWAEELGDAGLKADLSLARSVPGMVSSLLGGFVAVALGRRVSYFLLSLLALGSTQYLFWFLAPDTNRQQFVLWYGITGFVSGFFFGWMPQCLPELFPTRLRSTGAGVSFNWPRIVTAVGVLSAGELLRFFDNNYAFVLRATSMMYAVGMVVIWFIPKVSEEKL